ncbi:branched-chain amino acid transport system ATP-binding protein [Rhodopseudomonas julia]|uniref:Branched-chain amino acid transport system ATP-binding protein n=1 Tax=Rhodopseudomonas julia TaxID=200617 RepID=A0ABU0C4N4_9BRAD|nr:ABC transporter ATP-binding protein [Rhodopseudomonas julia]MDQ0325133.1 branched-chain amino acid transport system ATP-binding protein [Rhodopseudomonas julia]
MRQAILEVDGISKHFGGLAALDSVSFDVAPGEIVGLIGPNGAGKSTLFSTLVGLHKPTDGIVRLEGEDITGLKPHKVAARGLTKTFQNVALFMEATVLDNVLIGGLLRANVHDARELAKTCLARVGLAEIAGKKAADLSFPERARVEVARALATKPKGLLLDEVMAALNRVEMEEIMDLIRSLSRDGLAVVVVEHHMHAIMTLCERIVVLNFGKKIAEGTPEEIARHPEVVRAYLGQEYE